jgi:uncharacterized protein (TIGR03435 family)
MRIGTLLVLSLALVSAGTDVFSQAPAQSSQTGPTFDVVSIRRNTTNALGSNGSSERPDGGFTLINIPVGTLIARAYPPVAPVDMVGLPAWASSDRYDVSAASSLGRAAPEDRIAMMRAMLADRFKLVAHVEKRVEPVYDLVLARSDRTLGPGIKPSEIDCVSKAAAERAAAEAAAAAGAPPPPRPTPAFNAPVPPCTVRMTGPQMEGDMTMERLAVFLRAGAGRWVVDKTGLTGSYRVTLNFDRMASLRGPDAAPAPGAPPSVFTAVQEQLGMRLESSRAMRDTLVVDRLERPTEN